MTLLKDYQRFWKANSKVFVGQNLTNKGNLPVTERDFIKSLGHYRLNKKVPSPYQPNTIPYIEISKKRTVGSSILFVGMNPSGADVDYYLKHNKAKCEVFEYNNYAKSLYYQAMQKFANDCLGHEDADYSVLDVFGIVQGTQGVIVHDFLSRPNVYKEMFEIFLKAIVDLNPKVIIVANAFIRRLLLRGNEPKDVLKSPQYNIFYAQNPVYQLTVNPKFGGYEISIHGKKYQLYFSCMLSGQHALDLGNRENLIWLVRNYLKNMQSCLNKTTFP